jgi:ATP-dependent Lon protease
MTGEITLSGLVFPVGGIKGKVLAAQRAGIKRIVLPKRNEPDFREIPKEVLRDIQVLFVERIDEALRETLTPEAGRGAEDVETIAGQETPPPSDQVPAGSQLGLRGGQ